MLQVDRMIGVILSLEDLPKIVAQQTVPSYYDFRQRVKEKEVLHFNCCSPSFYLLKRFTPCVHGYKIWCPWK